MDKYKNIPYDRDTMTKSGKIKIASIISLVLLAFGTLVVLAGQKIIVNAFLENIYIYCKFGLLIIGDSIAYLLEKGWSAIFTSWKIWVVFVIIAATLLLRWLFGYHSE